MLVIDGYIELYLTQEFQDTHWNRQSLRWSDTVRLHVTLGFSLTIDIAAQMSAPWTSFCGMHWYSRIPTESKARTPKTAVTIGVISVISLTSSPQAVAVAFFAAEEKDLCQQRREVVNKEIKPTNPGLLLPSNCSTCKFRYCSSVLRWSRCNQSPSHRILTSERTVAYK